MPRPDNTVKIFDSSMAGAPALSGTAGALIAVLDACLVNGFALKTIDSLVVSSGVATLTISTGHSAVKNSVVELAGVTPAALNGQHKVVSTTTNTVTLSVPDVADQSATGTMTMKMAAAGWSKAFSGTSLAAYKSPNAAATGLYLRVDDTGALESRWVGYETMTDVNTGVGAFPTAAQLTGGQYIPKANNSTGTRAWWIVANDRTVYIGIAHHSSYTAECIVYGFGDAASRKSPDAYKFFVTGNSASTSGTSASAVYSRLAYKATVGDSRVVMARSYSALGGAITLGVDFGGYGSTFVSGNGPRQYPNAPDNALLLEQILFAEDLTKAIRATPPGIYGTQQAVGVNIGNDSALSNFAGLSGRTLIWKAVGDTTPASRGGIAVDVTGPWSY